MAIYRKLFGKKNETNAYASSRYDENNFRCPQHIPVARIIRKIAD